MAVAADAPVDCEAQVTSAPAESDSWRCFYLQARRDGDWDGARDRLQQEADVHPENGHAWLNLAHIAAALGTGNGVELYDRAVAEYTAAGDSAGQVMGHIGRSIHRAHLGAPSEEVFAGLEQAAEAAEASGEPLLKARVDAQQARMMWRLGGDVGRAYTLVRSAEQLAFPDGPYQLRLVVLHVLAGICQETGRLDEAAAASQRLVELTAAAGDRYVEATARLNVAHFALSNPDRVPPGTGALESKLALEAARAVGNPFILAGALCTRAGFLQEEGAPSLDLWEQCAAGYVDLDEPLMAASARLGIASAVAGTHPDRAVQESEAAVSIARAGGDETLEVFARLALAGFTWDAQGPEAGTSAFALHHEAAERLIDHQTDGASRAGVRSNVADGHYLLAARLQDLGPTGYDAALAQLEQLRARELTEALREHDLLAPEDPDARAALDELAAQLSRINISLGETTDPDERESLAHQREKLEYQEAVIRLKLERSRHPTGRPAPTIAEVQAALAPGEVVLSFQTPNPLVQLTPLKTHPRVLAIDHESVAVAELSDRLSLDAAILTFAGLYIEAGLSSTATRRAAAATWDRTVGPALDALGWDPGRVPSRLVVIPDGPLHELPFSVLRPSPDAPPLGTTTALSRTPSVTSWFALRDLPAHPPGPGLSFGDPSWPRAAGEALAALPAARRETRALSRALGADVYVGDNAQEAILKNLSAAPKLVHIAAHGRDPASQAGRHALILGDGDGEDGLLEAREVRDLPLDGSIVLLSACRGASGRVLAGDGLDGLSRAFLLAGAPVVVGSLWPIPDGDAARFFERLAPLLADGRSVDDALRQVRADLHAEGVPESAWAGMVAIGDARRQLQETERGVPWMWGVLAMLGLAGGLVWLRKR